MEIIDFVLDPFRSGIDRRAVIELALIGSLCGSLGFWVLTERLAYGAESLSHGLLPGLVLAALAGAPLLLGAAGGALAAAGLIAVAARDTRVGADTGIAVAVTGLVGIGALLALAVIVGPPLAVRGHARTPARAMLAGSAVAVGAAIVGMEVSFHAHSAAGASVALALCAAAALGVALRPWPGAARRAARPRSPRRPRAAPGR
jgi:ABC-type Mn2+/Zn2+ transport system permease subunit